MLEGNENRNIKLTFNISAERGASQLLSFTPEGYKVKTIVRKNTKAVVTYEKIGE